MRPKCEGSPLSILFAVFLCPFFWYLPQLIWTQYVDTARSPNSTPSRRSTTVTTRSICGPLHSLNAAASCARTVERLWGTPSLNPPDQF